jgi:hypothetical protein
MKIQFIITTALLLSGSLRAQTNVDPMLKMVISGAPLPQFDEVTGNCTPGAMFTLMAGSPAIDHGDFIWKVTSPSGYSNQATVTNGSVFVKGRYLKTQGKQAAIVTNINGNTITVRDPINWVQGEGVVEKMYYGNKPDAGACEYVDVGSGSGPSTPQGVRAMTYSFLADTKEIAKEVMRSLPVEVLNRTGLATVEALINKCLATEDEVLPEDALNFDSPEYRRLALGDCIVNVKSLIGIFENQDDLAKTKAEQLKQRLEIMRNDLGGLEI